MDLIIMFFMPVTIVLIICLFLTWFFLHKARHREKLLRLEKGLEPMPVPTSSGRNVLLTMGILVIGVSVGMALVTAINRMGYFAGDGIFVGIVGGCSGIALIIASKLNKA